MPRSTLTYTVTIKNTGNVSDNYNLTVNDNASPSWSPSVSPTSIALGAGASGNATLSVTIPAGTAEGARDNIKIRATSRIDNTIENENSCIAYATAENVGVRVTIDPASKSGAPGEELDFLVTVTNTGMNTDTFTLTATDTENWGPTLSISSTTLAAGASRQNIRLSITIPSTADEGDSTTITVGATGTGYENDASCIAHAKVVRGVDVSISPESQTGRPGKTLMFTVTVKNTGEVECTYDLTVSDDALWGARLDENVLTILPGDNTVVIISVTVPNDAIENEFTQITVTATSRADDTVSASDTCRAVATVEAPSPPKLPWVIEIVLIVIAMVAASALYMWRR
jgi:uncharacterized membrane protein